MEKSLAHIRHFFLDMDGTIYLGPNPLSGAVAFVRYLQEKDVSFLFFTNNPSANAAQYAEKLSKMGIEVEEKCIFSAGEATAQYLATQSPHRQIYALGTPAFEGELRKAGLQCVGEGEDADAVVLAFDKTLTYAKLENATLLLSKGLPYFATNPDLLCPTEYGYIPDCGSMAALLKAATGREPKYIGKPNAEMINMGLARLGADAQHCAMVGDRLYTDMEMAHRAGITSILVLSGESKRADLEQVSHKPDFCFDSVAELHAALAKL